jgi:DNA replication protein DnaC
LDINEVLKRKLDSRIAAIKAAELKSEKLKQVIPGLADIDSELHSVSMKIMNAAMTDKMHLDAKLEAIKTENNNLLIKRASLLEQNGYSADYDSPQFECPICSDTGYIGLTFCECVKKQLSTDIYTSSGLGKALFDKSFDNFSLKYYSGKGDGEVSDKENMTMVYNLCKRYAQRFTPSSESILMIGGTGLGKTHLSAAIAKGVLEKGYYVIYDSAQSIFDGYDAVRFGKEPKELIKKYENCDLLIIDDLGAECLTQYTVAVFSSLLNWRIVNSKPTIISTNLSPQQIKKNYGERVYSRLLGESLIMKFSGQDIRLQKLSEKK